MSAAVHNARHAEALVGLLAASGVGRAVVSPGSRNTPLVLALDGSAEIEVDVVLDERTAGFYALGLARASGAPVVLCCTSGSAGAHYLPAVIEAFYSRVPLVVLTADRPPELHGCGAPQTIRQGSLFGDFVRAAEAMDTPSPTTPVAPLRSLVARVMSAATGLVPGPVHVNCPFREPLWAPMLSGAQPARRWTPIVYAPRRRVPDEASLAAVAARLASVDRGLIVAGPMAQAPGEDLRGAVAELARRLGWPVLAEPASQVRYGFGEDGLLVTTADALLRAEAFAPDHVPELVLRLGPLPTSKPVARLVGQVPSVAVDAAGAPLDPGHRIEIVVEGAPAAVCAALAQLLPAEGRVGAWAARWRRAEAVAEAALDAAAGDGFWEGAVASTLGRALPAGAMLHVSSSMPIRDLGTFTRGRHGGLTVFSSRGANGIDGTVATALGEASAHGGAAVLLCGDLALQHDLGSLVAAAGLGVSLVIVVVDNDGGGIFHKLPISAHPSAFERYFLTPQSVDLPGLCRGAGAEHVRVDDRAGLMAALALSAPRGVRVIQAVVDRQGSFDRRARAFEAVNDAFMEVSS